MPVKPQIQGALQLKAAHTLLSPEPSWGLTVRHVKACSVHLLQTQPRSFARLTPEAPFMFIRSATCSTLGMGHRQLGLATGNVLQQPLPVHSHMQDRSTCSLAQGTTGLVLLVPGISAGCWVNTHAHAYTHTASVCRQGFLQARGLGFKPQILREAGRSCVIFYDQIW